MAHTIILLTGKQGSGKTTIINLMRKAKEIEVGKGINEDQVLKNIEFYETIVFTTFVKSKLLVQILEIFCKKHNLTFLNIELS